MKDKVTLKKDSIKAAIDDVEKAVIITGQSAIDETIRIAAFSMGTGCCYWENADCIDQIDEEMIDECSGIARTYPAVVPASLQTKIRRIIDLNKERSALANQISEELDARFELELKSNQLDPVIDLNSQSIVTGSVRIPHEESSKEYLFVDGEHPACENGCRGIYCYQTCGFCGDDFRGIEYILLDGVTHKYLRIPFEY